MLLRTFRKTGADSDALKRTAANASKRELDALDEIGDAILHHVCRQLCGRDAIEWVKLLIVANASINLFGADGATPLHRCCQHGHGE
eukprot:5826405-Prymnesium_polylepis.1